MPGPRKQALTSGAHHVGLTVADLEESRGFFMNLLGFEQIGELPDYPAVFLTDGSVMITLWQTEDPELAAAFDRKNSIGLHHLALAVRNIPGLDELFDRISASEGVEIEFGPEPLLGGPARHMMCSIPGGIRMEFVETE